MKLVGMTALFYVGVICNPLQWALADLHTHPPGNAYSPYSMYERCHWRELHLTPQHC